MRPNETREAVRTLCQAFIDNPATLAIIDYDERERRERILRRVLSGFVRAYSAHGDAYVVHDAGRIVAVSLSAVPGRYPLPVWGQVIEASGCVLAGPRMTYRYARIASLLHPLHPKSPHYYLFFLGVLPEMQGRGLGALLLAQLAREAAERNVFCYLETDKESSVRLYQRHGYEIVDERVYSSFHDLRMWFMRRPAP